MILDVIHNTSVIKLSPMMPSNWISLILNRFLGCYFKIYQNAWYLTTIDKREWLGLVDLEAKKRCWKQTNYSSFQPHHKKKQCTYHAELYPLHTTHRQKDWTKEVPSCSRKTDIHHSLAIPKTETGLHSDGASRMVLIYSENALVEE